MKSFLITIALAITAISVASEITPGPVRLDVSYNQTQTAPPVPTLDGGWSGQIFYAFKDKSTTPVASKQVGQIPKVFGVIDITILGFAGYNLQRSSGVAGFAAGIPIQLNKSNSFKGFFGLAAAFETNHAPTGGVMAGLEVKF